MAAQSQSKQGNLNLYTPLTVVEAVKCVSSQLLHALCWPYCSGQSTMGDCRALLKFIILQRSGDRILTDGGMTSGDGLAGVAGSSLQTSPEMRAQANALLPCHSMQHAILPQILYYVTSYFTCVGASTTMLQSHQAWYTLFFRVVAQSCIGCTYIRSLCRLSTVPLPDSEHVTAWVQPLSSIHHHTTQQPSVKAKQRLSTCCNMSQTQLQQQHPPQKGGRGGRWVIQSCSKQGTLG